MKQGLRTAGREVAMIARVPTAGAAAASRLAGPGLSAGLPGRMVSRAGAAGDRGVAAEVSRP